MISIPAIAQTTLSSLTAISPLSLQGVSSSPRAGGVSAVLLDSMSSIVQLSARGQVLSAGSVLKTSLQSLQTGSSVATAGGVVSTTQAFVAAFNQAQTRIGNALPLLGSQSGATLIRQFGQTLNAAATGLAANPDLQAIGISAQTAVVPATVQTIVTLGVDQTALTAAATANPAAAQTLLNQATQPLLQQVARFEAIATSPNGLANQTTAQTVGIPAAQLQNLSADILANTVQLGDLDLAALGLDAATIESANAARYELLGAALTAGATANAAPAPTPTRTGVGTPQTPADLTPAVAAANTAEGAATALATPVVVTATPATATTAATAVAQANPPAQQAPLNNEAQRVINNNAFNPFYSAVVASYHLNDGATPRPRPLGEPLIPAPVLAVPRVRTING